MKCLVSVLLAACLGPGIPLQGADGARVPTAPEILKRLVEASGGQAALEKVTNRVVQGRIQVAALGAEGAFKAAAKAPNKQVSSMDLAGLATLREGYDGKVAWTVLPFQGVREKSGEELERVRRTSVFPRELKLKDVYDRFEVKGATRLRDVDAWLLEAFPKSGKPDRFYFDQKTGLLLREESTVKSLMGEMTFIFDFSDYRDADGVKVPFSIDMPQPAELGFKIRVDSVKHNVPLPDSEFSKPAG